MQILRLRLSICINRKSPFVSVILLYKANALILAATLSYMGWEGSLLSLLYSLEVSLSFLGRVC